jgi:predicted TPR repeat methyltransferase
LKEQGHYLVGIENDRSLAEKAKNNYDVLYHADIESFDFPYQERFDVILFADVWSICEIPTLFCAGRSRHYVPTVK